MKDQFIEKCGLLFMKCEPEPMQQDSPTPCIVQFVQDDSPMGLYNKHTQLSDKRYICREIQESGTMILACTINAHYSRLNIVAKHCPEGSKEWALWQMLNGKKVCNHSYHGGVPLKISDSSVQKWARNAFEYNCEIVSFMRYFKEYQTGWQIYKEPKPLLADAKEGWLVINRAGHTSTIKYIDNNNGVLKYAYEVSDGTTIYVRENGMFNIINHNSNYDIVSAEPLAPEGSADWAWQMLMLGIPVSHPAEGELQDTNYTKEGFVRFMAKTGWQIYKEPKPEVDKWYWNKAHNEYCYAIKHYDDQIEMRCPGTLSTYFFDLMEVDDLVEAFLDPDFSNAKVGDECYSVQYGSGTIRLKYPQESVLAARYVSKYGNPEDYKADGKLSVIDSHPTLFHSAAQCAAYFAEVALKERGGE